MSVLDDLKKEVERQQQQVVSEQEQKQRMEKLYEAKFRSRMVASAKYLHQLINQVKAARLEIPVHYPFPEIGDLELKQKGYVLSADCMEKPHRIGVQVDCIADQIGEWRIEPLDHANNLSGFLDSNAIEYTEWSLRNSSRKVIGRVFKMQPKVRVWFIVETDLRHERLRVRVINYDFEGEKTLYFRPEDVTKEWLDRLARYILRKGKDFGALEIMDVDKNIIQAQMEEAEMLRQMELELAERKKDGVFSKLMDTLNKPIF